MKRVLIADDHAVTRRGLREILRDEYGELDVVEAGSTREAARCADADAFDLILLDLRMPGGDVLALISKLRSEDPKVPILIVTALEEVEFVIQTMRAGASGLIHKYRASEELVEAIRSVAEKGRYLHADTALEVASFVQPDAEQKVHERLSARELEIFRSIALGMTVKETAHELQISDKTVSTYLSRIREKTGLSNHVEIARYSLLNGLVE